MTNLISAYSVPATGNMSKMITSDWFDEKLSTTSSHTSAEDRPLRFYSITDNIFGFYSSETADQSILQRNLLDAISQVKKNRGECNIKIFWLMKKNDILSKSVTESVVIEMDLSKPPKLNQTLKLCENVFDWLAKSEENIVLFSFSSDEAIFLTVVYSYSQYYDSLLRRDLPQSVAIKSFINFHSKVLEKVPVSHRRYAGYMSLYSCMNQLQSYKSSVNMYCLILYNFPAMESSKNSSSQLFFKIYTNDPLRCSHTTKLYCLPSNVNRLVILFDQYPIVLRNDTMIICYHSSLVGNRRTKIFRLNFHTCQVTSDVLTFYSQDFENLYPGCPFKIKLDLYFQATAVFGQGEFNFSCDSTHSQSTQLERFDSYQSLSTMKSTNVDSSHNDNKLQLDYRVNAANSLLTSDYRFSAQPQAVIVSSTNKNQSSTDTTNKDQCLKQMSESTDINNQIDKLTRTNQISNNISPPEKSETCVLTEVLEAQKAVSDLSRSVDHQSQLYKSSVVDQKSFATEACHTAINISDSFKNITNCGNLKNLKLDNKVSSEIIETKSRVIENNQFQNTIIPNKNPPIGDVIKLEMTSPTNCQSGRFLQGHMNQDKLKQRELYTELLDAQKEISLLRRSMKHLEVPDQSGMGIQRKCRSQGLANDVSESYKTGETNINQTFYSINDREISNNYSAHRENIEREKALKENLSSHEKNVCQDHCKQTMDILEEFETINLQPIGKGIHDLYYPRVDGATESPRTQYNSHVMIGSVGSQSSMVSKQNMSLKRSHSENPERSINNLSSSVTALSPRVTINKEHNEAKLESIERSIQTWYRPSMTREEAIVILKNCCPGSFLVRDSNTFSGAYGLAVKTASIPTNVVPRTDDFEAEKIRHYLIVPVGNQGVCVKGFPEEPIFPTLSHLVLFYTQTLSVLPSLLVLTDSPDTASMNPTISTDKSKFETPSNRKVAEYSLNYLGFYDVEHLTGPSVINKSIERLVADLDPRKFTECRLLVDPGEVLELVDVERRLFFKRRYPFSNITYCSTDPKNRKIEFEFWKTKKIWKSKIFGLIVKNCVAGESKCLLFAEMDPNQNVDQIVSHLQDCIH